MKIKVYQINAEKDINGIAFLGLGELEQFQKDKVQSNLYDLVFDGEVETNDLEGVYRIFNLDRPEKFGGRSMSVSDVVEMDGDFYFCDSFGFKKIGFNPEECGIIDEKKEDVGMIDVLLVEPGKVPLRTKVARGLESMQKVVGGMIEEYMPFSDDVAIVCNEEGKLNGLQLNRAIYDEENKEMIDIIAGTFFIAWAPFEESEFQSLPEEMFEKYERYFHTPQTFCRVNDEIVALPMEETNE